MKTDLVAIPGRLIHCLQSLDVSVNKPFKNNIRKLYTDWMAADGHELTLAGKIERPSVELMGDWIIRVWVMVSMDVVVKSFWKQASQMCLMGVKMTQYGTDDNEHYTCKGESGSKVDSSDNE